MAMKESFVTERLKGIVEADETYVGARRKRGTKRGRPGLGSHKAPVVAFAQRGGKVRSMYMDRVTGQNLKAALGEHVDPSATLMTDELSTYRKPARAFADHQTAEHRVGQYVNGDAHVNTAEGFFSLLNRGINGTYHHIGKQHLTQYLSEFAFRYNTRKMSDGHRTIHGIRQAEGKRLMLRRPKSTSRAS